MKVVIHISCIETGRRTMHQVEATSTCLALAGFFRALAEAGQEVLPKVPADGTLLLSSWSEEKAGQTRGPAEAAAALELAGGSDLGGRASGMPGVREEGEA